MALSVRGKKTTKKKEEATEYKKLAVYVTIVNYSYIRTIIKLFESLNTSVSFVQVGEGTSKTKFYDIFGVHENNKGIIYAIVTEEKLPEIKSALDDFFKQEGENKGIGFSISLTSIIGMKLYHFLSNTY